MNVEISKSSLKSFSEDQRMIVNFQADARILVIVGPGMGKTHTLIYRLFHLAQKTGLPTSANILVIYFSRLAVTVILIRLANCQVVSQLTLFS
jgi:ATP-dependent DNA helicase RecQ